jgi:hypothetical protein
VHRDVRSHPACGDGFTDALESRVTTANVVAGDGCGATCPIRAPVAEVVSPTTISSWR